MKTEFRARRPRETSALGASVQEDSVSVISQDSLSNAEPESVQPISRQGEYLRIVR